MTGTTIKPIVRELADLLKEGATIDESNNVKYVNEEAKFEAKLGPIAELEKAQDHLLDFAAAKTLATGELGQDHMVRNKDVSRVTSRTNIGRGRIDTSYDREVSGTAAGQSWTKRGRALTDIKLGTGQSTRPYRDVLAHLNAEADKVFSN